jgi:hypothetical protein
LHRDLDIGDMLIEAQGRVSSGWKRWLRENCFLSVRTAMLYMQLARHRAEIEAEIERMGELSLRAAIRLIAKSDTTKKKKTKKAEPTAAIIAAMNKATDVELTEALIALSFDRFMQVMPAEWRPKIEARLGGQIIARAKAQHPNIRLKHLDKQRLRLVSSTEHPTPPAH